MNTIVKKPLLSKKEKLNLIFLISIGTTLTIAYFLWWFQPSHIPNNFNGPFRLIDIILFLLLSYVVRHQIANELFIWFVVLDMKKTEHIVPETGKKVAFLTAFVPGKEPYDVLENTLRAMSLCDYPHDTWVLDEGDDDIAKTICRKFDVKHFSRKNILYYNSPEGCFKAKTKAGNYNAWYDAHSSGYEFVAQVDVDFVPKKEFLIRTLGYFRDPEIAFVGSPQIYGNQHESLIARGAAQQAFSFYGTTQRGLFGRDMTLFIGANHVVRVAAHENIEGYSGHIVEDHLTGMRFYAKSWKSVYVPEILAIGEGPATWDAYFGQQMRWAYGLIDILLRESPKLFPRMKKTHAFNYFFLQQYYFDGLAQGIGMLLIILYFLFGLQSSSMSLLPVIVLFLPLIIFQQVIFLHLQKYNIDPTREKGMHWMGKLLNFAAWPVYLLAFVSVIVGKRLAYTVTPKGSAQSKEVSFSLFMPHLVLGTMTFLAILAGFSNHHLAPQLLLFAGLNTVVMYFFVFQAVKNKLLIYQSSQLALSSKA